MTPTPQMLWGSEAEKLISASFARARWFADADRRRDAAQRREILEDDWRDLLETKLRAVYTSDEVFQDLRPLISTEHNVLKRIGKELSTVYQWGAQRELADKEQNRIAHLLWEETQIDETLEIGNLYTNVLRDIIIEPQVVDGKMRYELITPERLGVIQHPLAPTDAVAYWYDRALSQSPTLAPAGRVWERVYADAEVRRTYDMYGRLVNEEYHGLGELPGVPVHADHRVDTFFAPEAFGDVVEATYAIGIALTMLSRLQKWQSEKQITYSGPIGDVAKGGSLGAQSLLGTTRGSGTFGTLELQATPEYYIKTINARIGWIAQQHGMSADVYTLSDASASGFQFRLKRLPLLEQRARQTKIWTRVERDLYRLTAKIAQREHPVYGRLDPSQVLSVTMGAEPGVEDPLTQARVYRENIDIGLQSQIGALMDKHGVTREVALKMAKVINSERALWIEEVRKLQTAADGSGGAPSDGAPTARPKDMRAAALADLRQLRGAA